MRASGPGNLLFDALPDPMHVSLTGDPSDALQGIVELMRVEAADRRPGALAIVTSLSQTLFAMSRATFARRFHERSGMTVFEFLTRVRMAVACDLLLRNARPSDVDRCYEIEISAYEGDEAATREKIATRIAQYPEGFLVMTRDDNIIGFINSGCAYDVVMSDEAFKELIGHDAAAPNVVIMSVVLAPEEQGRGYARTLMEAFIARMRAAGKATIHLMCKERHIPLYERLGYHYVKPSPSDHGGMAWHEMVMKL